MMLWPELRAQAAVHEAAHAVVGSELGLTVTGISMSGGDPDGHVFFTSFDAPAEAIMRERPEEMGPTLLAGKCAETAILKRHIREGYGADVQIIRRACGQMSSRKEAEKLLLPWVERARELVAENRDAIETIAAELLIVPRLTGAEIQQLRERSKTAPERLPLWAFAHVA
jgi:ATP-dependent Zn protease